MSEIVSSCAVDTAPPCDDTGGGDAGVAAWALAVGPILLIAAIVTVVVLLRRAARRAPWE